MKYKSFEDFKADEAMLKKMYEAVTKFCGDVSEMTMDDGEKKEEKDEYKGEDKPEGDMPKGDEPKMSPFMKMNAMM